MAESPQPPKLEKDLALEHPGKRACESLERALGEYERYMLLAEAYVHAFTESPHSTFSRDLRSDAAIKHWEKFRDFLLHINIALLKEDPAYVDTLMHDIQRFIPSQQLIEFDRKTQNQNPRHIADTTIGSTADAIDPFLLLQTALWTAASRRVISLNETAVSGFSNPDEPYPMTWDTIMLPHDTFMIEVPKDCLRHDIYGVEHQLTSVLVSTIHTGGATSLMIRPFWEETRPRNERVDFDAHMLRVAARAKKKNWSSLSLFDFISEAQNAERDKVSILRVRDQGQAFKCTLDQAVDMASDNRQTRIIKRIIAGTSLYMASAREGTEEPAGNQSQKVNPKAVKIHSRRPTLANIVTDAASVLSLQRFAYFSPTQNKVSFTTSGGSLQTAHVVRKHYRRRPNTAVDAPKDIKVASYWKGLDTLPDNALPSGVATKISL